MPIISAITLMLVLVIQITIKIIKETNYSNVKDRNST